jgi:hypothetical protein
MNHAELLTGSVTLSTSINEHRHRGLPHDRQQKCATGPEKRAEISRRTCVDGGYFVTAGVRYEKLPLGIITRAKLPSAGLG